MLDKLIDLLISALKLFQFWVVIYPYERGILLRLGKYNVTLEPGFHWCMPMKIDRVITADIVTRTLRLGAQSLVTKDQKPVVLNTVVTCEILDVKKALLDVHSIEHVIDDSCSGFVAAFVADHDLGYIVKCCAIPDKKLLCSCQKQAGEYGIGVMKVQFTDVTPSRTFRMLNSTVEAASYWADHSTRSDRL